MNTKSNFQFDGPDYNEEFDQARLSGQIRDIYNLIKDGQWRTLKEIEDSTLHPQSSISAQLRHLRKERFGSHTIIKQRRGKETNGIWEYRLKQENTLISA